MRIFAVTLMGKTFTLFVEPYDTIEDIKWILQSKGGIPQHQIKLFFNGKNGKEFLQNDERTLEEYGIENEHTIRIVLTLGSGRGHPPSLRKCHDVGFLRILPERRDVIDHRNCIFSFIFDFDNRFFRIREVYEVEGKKSRSPILRPNSLNFFCKGSVFDVKVEDVTEESPVTVFEKNGISKVIDEREKYYYNIEEVDKIDKEDTRFDIDIENLQTNRNYTFTLSHNSNAESFSFPFSTTSRRKKKKKEPSTSSSRRRISTKREKTEKKKHSNLYDHVTSRYLDFQKKHRDRMTKRKTKRHIIQERKRKFIEKKME